MKILKRWKTDGDFRTFFASAFSCSITLLFAIYNFYLGLYHRNGWNISIAIYYFLLITIKVFALCTKNKPYKPNLTALQSNQMRSKLLLFQSIFLFITDLTLIAPIMLMLYQQRAVDYTSFTAIAISGFTFYKLIAASIGYSKYRKTHNISARTIRNAHFKDALVSVILLQYVLVMTFGTGNDDGTMKMCALISCAIWIVLIMISTAALTLAIAVRNNIR